ncbi:MAG: ATP-binding protein [Candidatus Methanomethylophilaceae archaeon]|nr:ATP-binding protein [Candidatus Methanomethylophilaceae archaeon]MBP5395170.1 ATP-binding protein [Candidatus Methanomethylophilaceae archaeon]
MKRKIYDELLSWKKDKQNTCLTIKGQRQVGKTYIVEQFGRENYEHFVEIDFSRMPQAELAFERGIDVDSVIRELSMRMDGTIIEPGNTLIFLDEIQECPKARASLKWFAQDGRYDVISSGSLLGVTNNNARRRKEGESKPLSPMGYERILTMRSMDFEEYLWAVGFDERILGEIKDKIRARSPLSESELEVMDSHFRSFMITGGMPASVKAFAESKQYTESGKRLDIILGDIVNDINRYNDPINAMKTQRCFESIPEHLSSNNKKFQYSRLEKGTGSRASAEKYMENLLWIEGAGYGNFCYGLETPELPFKRIEDSFKVYLSDTGMLIRMMGQSAAMATYDGRTEYNAGAIAENEVAECLVKNGINPRFYRKNSGKNQMEIDFVIELLDESVAIEVKSGKTRDSPSVDKVQSVFAVGRRMMFENGNLYVDKNGIEHYPMFAAAFIRLLERGYDGPAF